MGWSISGTEGIHQQQTDPQTCPESSSWHFARRKWGKVHTRRSTSLHCQNRLGEQVDLLEQMDSVERMDLLKEEEEEV